MSRLLLSSIVALAAVATPASACSCAPNPTAQGILATSAAVFTGVVESSISTGQDRSLTTFKVTESFKGLSPGESVNISHSSGSSAACGVAFSVGETYTLAAYQTDLPALLSTSLCSTWMFLPHMRIRKDLIEQMRAMRP
jgi:hypothetical protein